MSSHGRYDDRRRDSGGGRHDSSRRDSRRPSPPRRDRSPPPKPRNENELPEQFGRGLDDIPEDEHNVLQKMKNSFETSPLGELYKCIDGSRKIKVWTRNFKEVRGICTGYVLAFDKHWNLIMVDVDEVYLKPRKAKTPYLLPVESDGSGLPNLQPKVPKKKKNAAEAEKKAAAAEAEKKAAAAEAEKKKAAAEDSDDIEIIEIKDEPGEAEPSAAAAPPPPPIKEEPAPEAAAEKPAGEPAEKPAGEPAEKEKKKRKRKKRNKDPTTGRRNVSQLFVRGDNIVMISIMDQDKYDA